MIQRRRSGNDGWSPDPAVMINDAADLQSLLEAIVQRYRLVGAVVATNDGDVLARVGGALEDAGDGFEAALAATPDPCAASRMLSRGRPCPATSRKVNWMHMQTSRRRTSSRCSCAMSAPRAASAATFRWYPITMSLKR